MKLVKLGAAAALSTALLASGVAGFSAQATSGAIEGEDGKYGTTGDVEFKASEDIEKPVHPTDPDPEKPVTPVDPTDPEKPVGPGTAGPLSIDYVSSFNFGEQEIATTDKTYYSAPQTYLTADGEIDEERTSANYMQVTDKRGSSAGWALKVEQVKPFTAEDATTANPTLDGVTMKLNAGETNSTSDSAAPTAKTIEIDSVGSPQTILNANEKQGTGTWTSTFGEYVAGEEYQGVELTIPGKTQTDAVKYQTELKWALESTPDNDFAPDEEI
ncbi:MAG: WxL domain-containing protein [Kurthia sp.]|nr:WxL domain-containing protein [Candidatus Kurthia equi]